MSKWAYKQASAVGEKQKQTVVCYYEISQIVLENGQRATLCQQGENHFVDSPP